MIESDDALSEPKRSRAKWMRPVVLVLLSLVALLGSNLLYALVARHSTALSGVPGELLYVSTFDSFTDEWDLYEGQQRSVIVDDRLQILVSSAQTAGWSTAVHQFADFDVSLITSAIDGPIDNAFGIVFGMRSADSGNCEMPAVILCGLSQWMPLVGAALGQLLDPPAGANYYAFLISSDGYYTLRQVMDGKQEILSAWIPSEHIRQGLNAQNAMRAVAQGTELVLFVNGAQLMLCLSDASNATSTYTAGECIGGSMRATYKRLESVTGRLGVIVEATQTGGGGVTVQFDDIVVVSPGYPSLEDAKA